MNILMSNENLPSVHDLSKRDGLVVAPLLEDLLVVDEDDVVVRGTLVDDLGDGFTATSHGCLFDVCVGENGKCVSEELKVGRVMRWKREL